jgi:glycosyltransferase involved in cell wall biosynthesis
VDDGKTGWLAPPNDVEAWGKLLRDIWATPTSRLQEMGAANRERLAERHDWGKHLDALEQFYSEAGEPGPRA